MLSQPDEISLGRPSSTPKYLVDSASWRDLNALRNLEQVCFPLDNWPLLDLIGVLTFPNIIRLKASLNGLMTGFIAGDIRVKENTGWISTLGVLPHYRKMGIASALLEVCEAHLGMPCVRLNVRKSNYAAIQLYRKAGYQQVSVWPRYYSGGEDAFILEKVFP